MFDDNTFLYIEEKRRDLLQEAQRIRQIQKQKKRRKVNLKSSGLLQEDFTNFIKTGLAAIFHR